MGWLNAVVNAGAANEAYTIVPGPGFFRQTNSGSDEVQERGPEDLAWELGRFAAAVGCVRIARNVTYRGIAIASAMRRSRAAAMTTGQWAAAEAYLLGDLIAATQAALYSARGLALLSADPTGETFALHEENMEAAWNRLPHERREEALCRALTQGLAWPVFVKLLNRQTDNTLIHRTLDDLANALSIAGGAVPNLPSWLILVKNMHLAFVNHTTADASQALVTASPTPHHIAVLSVALARANVASPDTTCFGQAQALVSLPDHGCFGDFIPTGFTRWIRHHWQDVARQPVVQSFNLAQLQSALATLPPPATSTKSTIGEAARILLIADAAAGRASLDDTLRARLHRLEGIGAIATPGDPYQR